MSRIFQIDQDLFRLCDLRSMPTVHEIGVMKKMTSTQTSCTIFVRQKSLKMTNSMCIKFDGQNRGDSEVNTPGVAWHCNSGNGTKGRNKQVISSRTSCPVSSVTQVSPWHVIVIVAVATFCPKLHTRCQDLHTKNTENDGTKLVVEWTSMQGGPLTTSEQHCPARMGVQDLFRTRHSGRRGLQLPFLLGRPCYARGLGS